MKLKYPMLAAAKAAVAGSASAAPLVLTGIIDGPLSGGYPKAAEIYVTEDIADLSICGLGSANNGGGSDGEEFTFPADTATAGSYLYVSADTDGFTAFMGFAPNYISGAINVNGDDAIELFCNGVAIDLLGDIDVDGTGQPWEHLDGWAYRYADTVASATFNLADWYFSGPNALDGETSNATAANPFPTQAYMAPVNPPEPEPEPEPPTPPPVIGACASEATFISAIQGNGAVSPIEGSTVEVEAVVTAIMPGLNGFYIQEEVADYDADPATSEGLFVFANGVDLTGLNTGMLVRTKGEVDEYFGATQLKMDAVWVDCGTESVATTPITLPQTSEDQFEQYEGMLVTNTQPLVVADLYNYHTFGELVLSTERLYQPTQLHMPGSSEAQALASANALNQLILDDVINGYVDLATTDLPLPVGGYSPTNHLRAGDTVNGFEGIMDYAYNAYRIRPTASTSSAQTNPRTAEPTLASGNLKVASFNVLNLFNGDGIHDGGTADFPTPRGASTEEEYHRQLAKIVNALSAMDADVIGLMEIENDGFGELSAISQLVDALNEQAGSAVYAFVDAGAPIGSDEITTGLIYRVDVVTPEGQVQILNSVNSPVDENDVALFDDSRNRPSLAQAFVHNATKQKFAVNVNHLKSKGSSCGDNDDDTLTGQGNCNVTRTRAVQALTQWLPATFEHLPVLTMGDMNSYAKEDPIVAFVNGGFTDIAATHLGATAYGYTFDGLLGTLDYQLVNSKMDHWFEDVTEWHINADESRVIDYNAEFKPAFYLNDLAYRASDHDPVISSFYFDVLGDIDRDGDVDVLDMRELLLAVARRQATPAHWDLNFDGTVDRTDVTVLRSLCTKTGCRR